MKKAFKVIGIVVVLLIIFLSAAPFLFKGTIEKQVKKAINDNLNAQVEWSGLSLSLLSSFPDARLKLKNVEVLNEAPFAGDTLASAQTVFLDMGIPQLFKSENQALKINEIGLEKALINIKVNENGAANYDIAKPSAEENEEEESESEGIKLNIKKYSIAKSTLNYLDESSQMFLRLKDFNHKGSGDFSAAVSTLQTHTDTRISFAMDGSEYFKNATLKLDADIEMDLESMKFSFADNSAVLNQLPLEFDGFVKVNEDNQEMDVNFTTPSSDFKNFLGVAREEYLGNLNEVETTGNFTVKGRIYGVVDEQHIPKMNIALASSDASFKFPDLPKAVEQINFEAVLKNESGLREDMNLELPKLSFKIDQDVFSAHGDMKNLMGNTAVNLAAKGRLNLANIHKAYPVPNDLNLNGILDADMTASFMMDDIEKENYAQVQSSGKASLTGFSYTSEELAHPVEIGKAELSFNPGSVHLQQFDLKTGETDAQLSGTLQNLMGFLFKDQPIKGDFKLTSNHFSINDFMVKKEAGKEVETDGKTTDEPKEEIKIPSFLDAVLNFNAREVLYDNLKLENVQGQLVIKDEKASLNHIVADIFGGKIDLDGYVSTQTETPKFNVKVGLNEVEIAQSLHEMDLLKGLAPIAQAFVGNLTTKLNLTGDLTKDLTPIYSSLTGDGLAKIINASIQEDQLSFVGNLNDKLNFIDLNNIELKDLTTQFSFGDGGVNFKPFEFKMNQDIVAQISGKHSFDNTLDYEMDLSVPAKYLGKDISGTLAKLSKSDLENTKVDLPVKFTGELHHPQISLNMESAVKQLTNSLVDKQKENLKEKGAEILDGLFGKDKAGESDSTATDEKQPKKKTEDKVKDKAKEVFDDLFGKKKSDK